MDTHSYDHVTLQYHEFWLDCARGGTTNEAVRWKLVTVNCKSSPERDSNAHIWRTSTLLHHLKQVMMLTPSIANLRPRQRFVTVVKVVAMSTNNQCCVWTMTDRHWGHKLPTITRVLALIPCFCYELSHLIVAIKDMTGSPTLFFALCCNGCTGAPDFVNH